MPGSYWPAGTSKWRTIQSSRSWPRGCCWGVRRPTPRTLQKAIDLNPKQITYYYDLARMHLLTGQRPAATQVLVEAQQRAELVTTEDLAMSRQMEQILQQLARKRHLRVPEMEAR